MHHTPVVCVTGARHTAELTPDSPGRPPHTSLHPLPWRTHPSAPNSGDADLGAHAWLYSGRTAHLLHCPRVTLSGRRERQALNTHSPSQPTFTGPNDWGMASLERSSSGYSCPKYQKSCHGGTRLHLSSGTQGSNGPKGGYCRERWSVLHEQDLLLTRSVRMLLKS